MLSYAPFLRKTPLPTAFSRPLSRIFPATEKDFFAQASTTQNKEKCANALVTSPKEV
jgi:hypothetical protein